MTPLVIGSAGVAILLAAFVLNLSRKVSERSPLYLAMNLLGASLAAWYAWAGDVVPFVILEAVWAIVALYRLVSVAKKAHA